MDIATLKRMGPELIEVYYAPHARLSMEGLAQVRLARRAMMGEEVYGLLSFIPEDMDFDMDAMSEDHLAIDRQEGRLWAIAVVTGTGLIQVVLRLYLSYFPQNTRIHVTDSEQEARQWLQGKMEAVERAER